MCHLSCLWLNKEQLTTLQHQLQSLWWEFPNQPIVFTWVDWLQNHALEHLGLDTNITLKETVVDSNNVDFPQNQSEAQYQGYATTEMALFNILEYDLERQREEFMKESHTCDICFETKDGPEFQFLTDWRHSFCTECFRFHCEMRIKDGSVLRLYCPDQKCKTVIPHTVLREILKPEMFERWEKLVLSKALDTMSDIVYCPRCNACVVADDVKSSKLAQCVQCFYAFCIDCLGPWHRDTPCETKLTEETPNMNKQQLTKEEKNKRERQDISSVSFIERMKSQGLFQHCPQCRFYVERIAGCNFMHCSQCSTDFCWLCGRYSSRYFFCVIFKFKPFMFVD